MKWFQLFMASLMVPTAGFSQNLTPAQQCAVDLCGPASNYLPTRALGPFEKLIPLDVKQDLAREFNPLIEELNQISIEETRLRLDAVKLIGRPRLVGLTENEQAFLNFQVLYILAAPFFNEAVTLKTGGGYELNAAIVDQKASPRYAARIKTAMNAFLNSQEFRQSGTLDSMTFENYTKFYAHYLGEEPTSTTTDKLIVEYRKEYFEIVEKFGRFHFENLDVDLLFTDIPNAVLTQNQDKMLMRILSRITAVLIFVKNAEFIQTLAQPEISFEEAIKAIGWSERHSQLKTLLSSKKDLIAAKKSVGDVCRKNIVRLFAASPSDLKLRKSAENAQLLRVTAKKVLPRFLSGQALQGAEKDLDQVEFDFPTGTGAIKTALKEKFRMQLSARRARLEELKDASKGGPGWATLVARFLSDRIEAKTNYAEQTVLSGAQNFCESLEPDWVEDKAYKRIKKVVVGWQTVMFPARGAGTIAHELGHIVSFTAQDAKTGKEQFERVRACSTKIHDGYDNGFTGRFTEEDWADEFSDAIMRELRKSGLRFENRFCSYLDLDEDSRNYHSKIDFVDRQAIDDHSTTLLRAVRTEMNLGGYIPQSCKTALNPHRLNILRRACE